MSDPSKKMEPVPGKAPPAPKSEGNPALRMMGLPRLRARLPSRNWSIFLTITGSVAAAILYDRHHKKSNQQKWCNAVSHLSTEILPINRVPRKLTVYLAAPPGDGLQPAREYFTEYIKPVLVAAAVDWEVIEGRREGDVRAKLAEKIRNLRKSKEQPPPQEEDEVDMVKAIREKFGTTEEDTRGGDLVIGRHTWREYVRGLHEGWLGPLEEPPVHDLDSSYLDISNASHIDAKPAPQDDNKTVFDSTTTEPTEEGILVSEPRNLQDDATSATEAPKDDSKSAKSEESKQKPKATTKPPYILPDAYPSALLSSSTPTSFLPSTALHLPHLLGFLNTPIRIHRFLNKRHLADTAGLQVASLLLSPTVRPYEHLQQTSSSSTDEFTSTTPPSLNPEEENTSSTNSWEQQLLLFSEESDWHKSVRKPNPDSGPDQQKERPWLEPMVIDPRIGERMRTVDPIPGPTIPSETAVVAGPPAADPTTAIPGGPDDGAVVRGNSREWKGGAGRPQKRGWGAWVKGLAGWEEDESRCRGWEQGLVGDEDS